MFGAMKSGSRRRHEARVAREKACVAAGCKCYCHEPSPQQSMPWLLIVVALLLICFWWVPLYYETQAERNACEKTQTCEVCDVTSTGAPYNCRPDPQFGKNVTIRRDAK
jgi:hypothetical protein